MYPANRGTVSNTGEPGNGIRAYWLVSCQVAGIGRKQESDVLLTDGNLSLFLTVGAQGRDHVWKLLEIVSVPVPRYNISVLRDDDR